MTFMYIQDLAWNMARDYVYEECEVVKPEDLGLDRRCGKLYMNLAEGVIAVHKDNRKSLDYYGGFEYIDDSCIEYLGDYVFYLSEHDRVAEALEFYVIAKDEEVENES